jgi:hypothetical protein
MKEQHVLIPESTTGSAFRSVIDIEPFAGVVPV